MTQQVLSPWRATYVPGDWIVLAGPTSLVVIQPLANEWSELITSLWQQVLASSSMVELAEQLVAHGIADMPSFGAFFWTGDGMRSLVRGGVVVRSRGESVVSCSARERRAQRVGRARRGHAPGSVSHAC